MTMRRGLIAFALGLAAALVAAELLAARFLPVGVGLYGPDDALLFDLLPSRTRVQAMPPDLVGPGDAARVLVRTNARGYRGPELDAPKTRPRLVVAGDSFVMSENVPWDATFAVQLAAQLGDVEPVNLGRSGYGPDQTLLLLERELPGLEADGLVVVLTAYNDLGDLTRNRLFRVGSAGRLERLRPRVADAALAPLRDSAKNAERLALARLWDFRRTRADYVGWGEGDVGDYVASVIAEQRFLAEEFFERRASVVPSLLDDPYDADVAVDPEGPWSLAKRRLLTAVLRELRDLAARHRVPVAVVVTPAAPDVDPSYPVQVDPSRHAGYRRTNLGDALASSAAEAGLAAMDLTEAFAKTEEPSALFVGRGDAHWNARGQERAARVVGKWLPADLRDALQR